MLVQTISEDPLVVVADGVPQEVLVFPYTGSAGEPLECKYVQVEGRNYPIQYRIDFDQSLLPSGAP